MIDWLSDRVASTKFLGIHIDERLAWTIHIQNVCKTIARNVGTIHKLKTFVPCNVLRHTDRQTDLWWLTDIKKRQLNFVGHITRKMEMESSVLYSSRTATRGRPRENFLSHLKTLTKIKDTDDLHEAFFFFFFFFT